ncbi:acyl carrier protein [Flavobacterium faecale]|uniref:Acyl carrier protein n=1 Tax=Flavobacterium faecale TaxID=1355330 RepID=A0A2S1LDX4_9FLAO|nr:acyl carrier protein [Flavobacterium faecale]AWG21726.1 acyl carrier protein [Flavobacterium faecale]
MNKEEIIAKLKPIVQPFVNDEDAFANLTDKTHFITDLNINSANLVDIILDVEDIFGIVIDNESMEKMVDIENTIEIIQTKLAEK